jgi:hypothetical protein
MIKNTNPCQTKLIAPILNNCYENEKNESPTSETKISVKQIYKPKPLNIKSFTELNSKTLDKKVDLLQSHLNFYENICNLKLYKLYGFNPK